MIYILKPGLGHLDYQYSKLVNYTVSFWHKLKITPNILTTFGLISSIACVYFLFKRIVLLSLFFMVLRMYFDFADGITARKYNQTTKFGDWYDHLVDIVGFSIPLLIILSMTKHRIYYLVPTIIFMLCAIINVGCIEKEYYKETGNFGDSLTLASKLCFAPEVFKWLDNSVLYIVIGINIIIVCKLER